MRKFLLAAAFAAIAMPALAEDSGDAAFALLSKYQVDKQHTNYIRLQSTIAKADAIEIDAHISKLYGEPSISRSGLKVWEVENTNGNGSKYTTIMCGPDKKGGILISADRRGRAVNKAPKGQEKKKRQKNPVTKPTKSEISRRSQERD